MRLTSALASLCLFLSVASAHRGAYERRNYDSSPALAYREEDFDLSSRDILYNDELSERALFDDDELYERTFDDELPARNLLYEDDISERDFLEDSYDLAERDYFDEEELSSRFIDYDDLEVRVKNPKPNKKHTIRANQAKAKPGYQRQNKADRSKQWAAKDQQRTKTKATNRLDTFKNGAAARSGRPWQANKNGKRADINKAKKAAGAQRAEEARNKTPGKRARQIQGRINRNPRAQRTHNPQKVHWDGTAVQQLDRLGLKGKDRKRVKKFHTNTVKNYMTGINKGRKPADQAVSGRIFNLVHKQTSPHDKKMHVTGKVMKAGGAPIAPPYKPKNGQDPQYHHMYTKHDSAKRLPTALKKAVADRKGNYQRI
ncbi:hypothetical protein FA15DRAFT_757282 [Coprinopsis marcescibilis]|uniref:Uncharacterized protein n=1 Tax=Coprinopsis marcescibilis TaxID=230819 RepID=A0A5C3KRZ3_COPMA|nr:hypothetical protein FA15DRAFT_757282 [Coprinopsis marcescibilis]